MSLFTGLDLESAADDPFAIPDGAYDAVISEVKVGETRDGSKSGMTTVFKIVDGEHKDKTASRWLLIPNVQDPQNPTPEEAKALSFLKSHLLACGVPAERVNDVTAEDLIGTDVTITVKNKDGYVNIRKVEVRQSSDSLFG
jgi:hypothetical protein